MAINRIQKVTGASLIALAMTTAAPLSTQLAFAQDNTPATENPATENSTGDTAGENFQDAGDALQEAGQETVQGAEAAGENVQEGVNNAAQDAAQNAEAAAERAEMAAENAADAVQESFNWGWLGLLGLIGLFGLAGGNKQRRVEVDREYHQPTTTTRY